MNRPIAHVEAKGLKATDPGFDAAVINAIYDERARTGPDGVLAHFKKDSPDIQRGVATRFVHERRRALKNLSREAR